MVGVVGMESKTLLKTVMVRCIICGKKATLQNTLHLPSCEKHIQIEINAPRCPNCDTGMKLKSGKRGTFWSCPDYPICFGTRHLLNPHEDPEVL